MKASTALLTAAIAGTAAYAVAYVFRQKKLAADTGFDVLGYQTGTIGWESTTLTLFGRVTSKLDMPITVYRQQYEVFINDKKVGGILSKARFELPAHGYSDISIPVEFSPKEILNITWQNILKGGLDINKINFRVKGTMGVATALILLNNVPLDVSFTLADILKSKPKA